MGIECYLIITENARQVHLNKHQNEIHVNTKHLNH